MTTGRTFVGEDVKFLQGHIWVESEEGQGTTMTFALPLPAAGTQTESTTP